MPMDTEALVTIAASAVALLSPYLKKAGEEMAKVTGDIVMQKASDLWETVKNKFHKDPITQKLIVDLTRTPDDSDTKSAFRYQLKNAMESDEDFAKRLAAILKEAAEEGADTVFHTSISGSIHQLIQMGNVYGGNITFNENVYESRSFDRTITGISPYMGLIEIIPDVTSPVMDMLMDDLENVVLKEKCIAKVSKKPDTYNSRFNGTVLTSKSEIMAAVKQAVEMEHSTPWRFFEWSNQYPNVGRQEQVILTSQSKSLFFYLISTQCGYTVKDCTQEPIDSFFAKDSAPKTFTAFPSIYNDIMKKLNLHAEGELLKTSYIFGFEKMDFPADVLSSSRQLAMAVDKIAGTTSANISEIAPDSGRGLVVYKDSFGLMNSFYFLPYSSFKDLTALFDATAVFLFEHAIPFEKIPADTQSLLLNDLKQLAKFLGSKPFLGEGAYELLISQKEKEIVACKGNYTTIPRSNPATSRVQKYSEKNSYSSLFEIAQAITDEFEVITDINLRLDSEKITRKDVDKYTRVLIPMSYEMGKEPKQGHLTERLSQIIEALGSFVAAQKDVSSDSITSIKFKPFMLQGTILFIVKINWMPYPGENDIPLWDI
jgi:hypothetical protein